MLQGTKNGAKAEDLAEEAQDIEEVILKGKKLQKGGGDINKTFAENAGIKIERWISETKVFGQSADNTCAATSLRMAMDDRGFVLSEDYLAGLLETQKNDGASILDIPKLFDEKLYYYEMTTIAEEDIKFAKLLEKLEQGDKAIVSVYKDGFGSAHAKVLEKVENGKVFLRDPLPINQGASYVMKMEDFENIFNKKAVIIKK
ncbi:cysteine peptidase family C39 domain-containing protein [Epilithonimonas sp. UC225_85]|uniref:cysteine peptidase family C39 domain-containing protein n=1 Tax=Epilithonimonas sp. UC225_85 TaxID=3350167 RepID=UPI0036D25A58